MITKIDFVLSYLLSLFFLVTFAFSVWFLLFSKHTFLSEPLVLSYLVLGLLFSSSMQLVNHYIYLKGYDVMVKYYLGFYSKGKANMKLNISYRPVPYTRSAGKNYIRFTFHQFFSKKDIGTMKEASLGIKITMILFNFLLVLQLITIFVVFVLIADLIIF